MALTATHDGKGNVTLYGATATHDGAGNIFVKVKAEAAENGAEQFERQVREIRGTVELLDGSATVEQFAHDGALQSFEIQRTGEAAFFGACISHRLSVTLIDPDRALSITTAHSLKATINGFDFAPRFHVTETNRDEATNALTVTAYDALDAAAGRTVAELALEAPYTIAGFAAACAALLGLSGVAYLGGCSASFATEYPEGANYEGTETVRDALKHIAEATQTFCYVRHDERLCFKRPDRDGAAVYTIDREKYFSLTSGDNKRLGTVCSATELGDNVSASITESGSTQYVRDNPFWDMREDVAELVDAALENVGGLTINQFQCEWRGNPLLEIADKIALETKDGGTVYAFLLDDTLTYDGSLKQQTAWSYEESEAEDADNPTNLGEALKKTFAKVNKAEAEIQLQASRTQRQIDEISGAVTEVQQTVSQAITPEQLEIAVQKVTDDGVSKVTTSTGFTFDADGLGVSKSGSDISTQVTEDGLRVNRGDEEVLRADNQGVKAEDLQATTYLVIGDYSRFENWEDPDGESRTACFWVGNVQNKVPEDMGTEDGTEGDEE